MPKQKGSDVLMPHDVDAEEAVLGSLLIDPDAVFLIGNVLAPEDFYRERNGWVYRACLQANELGAINQVTVSDRLKTADVLEDVGGPAYLSYLVSRVATPFHVEHYAELVKGAAIHRRLIDVGGKIAGLGYGPLLYTEALAKAKELLDKLLETSDVRGFVHVSEIIAQKTDEVEHIKTGFPKLDYITQGGLPRQSLSVLGAETSMGKTAFGLALCRQAAARQNRVGIVTLEMSKRQLVKRLVYATAGVDSYDIRPEDYKKLEEAEAYVQELGIWIYAPGGQDFEVIKATISAQNAREGLDLVLYDYMGLENGPKAPTETLRRSAIVRALRALATDEDLAILAISQLSRPSGNGQVSELHRYAWSAEIEQHSDVAMFIRAAEDEDPDFPARKKIIPGHIDLDIKKQRVGKADAVIRFAFDKTTQRMRQL